MVFAPFRKLDSKDLILNRFDFKSLPFESAQSLKSREQKNLDNFNTFS